MTIAVPDIGNLLIDVEGANMTECIKFLKQVASIPRSKQDAERVLEHIASVIQRETRGKTELLEISVNQIVINLAFRAYYKLLHKHALEDKYFAYLYRFEENKGFLGIVQLEIVNFHMLYGILLSEQWKHVEPAQITEICLKALTYAVEKNEDALLPIIKVLNLICKKFPCVEISLPLDHIYCCLQSGISGMREETLILFGHSCQQLDRALDYFHHITTFWPWTNRNKLYLLSCILNIHSLPLLLAHSGYSSKEFFAGIRLSLSDKNLLAASQYVIKALSGQESQSLLATAAEILIDSNVGLNELQNFHSHWFAHIQQKEELFELMQQKPEVMEFMTDIKLSAGSGESFRMVLIFSMFSRQIFQASKLHFFKISTELIINCFNFKQDVQLLIFKFVVDNMSNFAIEDCLGFFSEFIRAHSGVNNAEFRNCVLGKVATIINNVAKSFSRLCAPKGSTTLETSVVCFFQKLHALIELNVASNVYQPKIFALKLLEILFRSLYADKVVKNAKNCSILLNEELGRFLVQKQVFDAEKIASKLLNLLDDPLGFDDVLNLTVTLLQMLPGEQSRVCTKLCEDFCRRPNIDECALSPFYARIALQSMSSSECILSFYNCINEALQESIQLFQSDPLLACKSGNHIFGYLNVLNEVIFVHPEYVISFSGELLTFLQHTEHEVLQMLNIANACKSPRRDVSRALAASFQDMDESLEILVKKSAFVCDNHEDGRRLLLLSFWLTLKACCDLATTIGCVLVPQSECSVEHLSGLRQCLQINVAVLTRCRHKGAIEAAGASIGKLTKCITSRLHPDSKGYCLLFECLQELYDVGEKQVSNTRRGAGFSIMFLHIIRNEEQRSRPILKRAMADLLRHLHEDCGKACTALPLNTNINCDRVEALTLHYLCVLVRDTELKDVMAKYHNEIMTTAIVYIDNEEWTVRNAALQLFGSLIPKIVGQRQTIDFEGPIVWKSSEVTYNEILRKLPKASEYILDYCTTESAATGSIILFLTFFANVDHLQMDGTPCALLQQFRSLMWSLLGHRCEKVRKLAAICFVRAHEFRCELPNVLLQSSSLLFSVKNDNFFGGLVCALYEGLLKMQHEANHTINAGFHAAFLRHLRTNFEVNFNLSATRKPYTLCKVLDLFLLVGFDSQASVVKKLVQLPTSATSVGHDLWRERLAKITMNYSN